MALSRSASLILQIRPRYISLLAIISGLSEIILTLHNVCSVHQGMFSTLGGVQYIGGCSVHRGDTMSTSGDVQYIGGIS